MPLIGKIENVMMNKFPDLRTRFSPREELDPEVRQQKLKELFSSQKNIKQNFSNGYIISEKIFRSL